MQNKANFEMAQQRLTAGQEKGYVRRYELCVCENKANFHQEFQVSSWKFQVATPHFTLQTSHFTLPKKRLTASLRAGLRAKQSQFAGPKLMLTPVWEKGYEESGSKQVVENKPNFGRAGPVRGGWTTKGSRRPGFWRQRFCFIHPPSSGRVCTAHQYSADGVEDGVRCTPYRLSTQILVGGSELIDNEK